MQNVECRVLRTKPHHAAALGHKDIASVVSGGGRALKGRGVESTWLLQIHAEVTKGGKAGVKGGQAFFFESLSPPSALSLGPRGDLSSASPPV
jgi:hypothetical protein